MYTHLLFLKIKKFLYQFNNKIIKDCSALEILRNDGVYIPRVGIEGVIFLSGFFIFSIYNASFALITDDFLKSFYYFSASFIFSLMNFFTIKILKYQKKLDNSKTSIINHNLLKATSQIQSIEIDLVLKKGKTSKSKRL